MPNFQQQKITRHAEKRKYDPYNGKKAGNRNCQSNQILDLIGKNFKVAIIVRSENSRKA